MNPEIILGVGMFTGLVLTLVMIILSARAKLVSSGDVTITVNNEKKITVPHVVVVVVVRNVNVLLALVAAVFYQQKSHTLPSVKR